MEQEIGHRSGFRAAGITFLSKEPDADRYIRPFPGSEEFINGPERWVLYLRDAKPDQLRRMPLVMERIAKVRAFREKSKKRKTKELAHAPTQFEVTTVPNGPFLVFPEVSSERRDYVPIGWLTPPTIPSNKLLIFQTQDRYLFGILSSKMHMAWLRSIGGCLKSDFQYSPGIVYNPFPWPPQNSKASRKPCSARAQRTKARRSPTSTIPMSCRRIYARRIVRSTKRWIGSIAQGGFCERPRKGGASFRLVRETRHADARRRQT